MALIHDRPGALTVTKVHRRYDNPEPRVHLHPEPPVVPAHLGSVDLKIWALELLHDGRIERDTRSRVGFRVVLALGVFQISGIAALGTMPDEHEVVRIVSVRRSHHLSHAFAGNSGLAFRLHAS
jgi:hypothetical protein